MKNLLRAAALAIASVSTQAADVGVSISIGQPGYYGRIDIVGYPPPQLIYSNPVFIDRVPANRAPIYLRVPPGHAEHWSKHCGEYRACDLQVYFVQDSWYSREYVPHYQERQGKRGNDKGNDRNDHRGRGR